MKYPTSCMSLSHIAQLQSPNGAGFGLKPIKAISLGPQILTNFGGPIIQVHLQLISRPLNVIGFELDALTLQFPNFDISQANDVIIQGSKIGIHQATWLFFNCVLQWTTLAIQNLQDNASHKSKHFEKRHVRDEFIVAQFGITQHVCEQNYTGIYLLSNTVSGKEVTIASFLFHY